MKGMQACCDVLIFVHKLIHGAGLIYGNYVNTGKSHWELYCRITTFSPTRELRCLAISLTASALPCVIRHESLSFSLMALFASSCRFRTTYFFYLFLLQKIHHIHWIAIYLAVHFENIFWILLSLSWLSMYVQESTAFNLFYYSSFKNHKKEWEKMPWTKQL